MVFHQKDGFYLLHNERLLFMFNISRVELLIKENGWSKPYFCRLFGHERTWISDWKRNRGLPDENTLQAIADKLGTTAEYLTDQTDIKNKPPRLLDDLTETELELIKKLREGPADVTAAVYRAAGVKYPDKK